MSSSKALTVLVTGANKGIGYYCVAEFAKKHPNWTILLSSRSLDNANKAIEQLKKDQSTASNFSNIQPIQLDVNDQKSVEAAVNTVRNKYSRLDVLINNAGIASAEETLERAKEIMATNYYGVQTVTKAFQPLLLASQLEKPIHVVVSSEVGAWAHYTLNSKIQAVLDNVNGSYEEVDNLVKDFLSNYEGTAKEQWPDKTLRFFNYSMSKAFLNGWGRRFAKKESKILTYMVTPGYCATDINNNSGTRTALQGALSCISPVEENVLITGKEPECSYQTGGFYRDSAPTSYSSKPI